jgi:hypothetical protein
MKDKRRIISSRKVLHIGDEGQISDNKLEKVLHKGDEGQTPDNKLEKSPS